MENDNSGLQQWTFFSQYLGDMKNFTKPSILQLLCMKMNLYALLPQGLLGGLNELFTHFFYFTFLLL